MATFKGQGKQIKAENPVDWRSFAQEKIFEGVNIPKTKIPYLKKSGIAQTDGNYYGKRFTGTLDDEGNTVFRVPTAEELALESAVDPATAPVGQVAPAPEKKDLSGFVKFLMGLSQGMSLPETELKTIANTGRSQSEFLQDTSFGADYLGTLIGDKLTGGKTTEFENKRRQIAMDSAKDLQSQINTVEQESGFLSPYNAGNVVGNMADFMAMYGAFGNSVEGMKLVQAMQGKLGTGIGGKIATELAKDVLIGTPINLGKALGNDLKGKDLAKDMALNFALDVVANTLMVGGGSILKKLTKSNVADALQKSAEFSGASAKEIDELASQVILQLESPEVRLRLTGPTADLPELPPVADLPKLTDPALDPNAIPMGGPTVQSQTPIPMGGPLDTIPLGGRVADGTYKGLFPTPQSIPEPPIPKLNAPQYTEVDSKGVPVLNNKKKVNVEPEVKTAPKVDTKENVGKISFTATVTDAKTGQKEVITSELYKTKNDFLKDLRRNGYKVNQNHVKPTDVWNYIVDNTNADERIWKSIDEIPPEGVTIEQHIRNKENDALDKRNEVLQKKIDKAQRFNERYAPKNEVFYTKNKTEVIKNPTTKQRAEIESEFKRLYPEAYKQGEPPYRTTYDKEGNTYIWKSTDGTHQSIQPEINKKYETVTDQNKNFDMVDTKTEVKISPDVESGTHKYVDTFADVDIDGGLNVDSIIKSRPELADDIKEVALELKQDLNQGIKGKRGANGLGVNTSTKRYNSDAIVKLLDNYGYKYDQVEKSLNRILDGKSTYPIDRRIEYMIDDMLTDGYRTFEQMDRPPNLEYLHKKSGGKTEAVPEKLALTDDDLDFMFDGQAKADARAKAEHERLLAKRDAGKVEVEQPTKTSVSDSNAVKSTSETKIKKSEILDVEKQVNEAEELIASLGKTERRGIKMNLQTFSEDVSNFRKMLSQFKKDFDVSGGKVTKKQVERIRDIQAKANQIKHQITKLNADSKVKMTDKMKADETLQNLNKIKPEKGPIRKPQFVQGQIIETGKDAYRIEGTKDGSYIIQDTKGRISEVPFENIDSLNPKILENPRTPMEARLLKENEALKQNVKATKEYEAIRGNLKVQKTKTEGKIRVEYWKEKGRINLNKRNAQIKMRDLKEAEREAMSKVSNNLLDKLKKMKSKKHKFSNNGYEWANRILEQVDTTAKSYNEQSMIDAMDIVKKAEEIYGADFGDYVDKRILKKLERLDKKQIGDMTLEEMEELTDAVIHIINLEDMRLGEFKAANGQRVKDAAESGSQLIPNVKVDEYGKIVNKLGKAKAFAMSYLNGETVFQKLSSYQKGGLYDSVFKPIIDGNAKRAGINRDFINSIEAIPNYHKIRKLLVDNRPKKHVLEVGEHKLNMSADELLDLYAASKDSWQANDLITGGYKQRGHADIIVFKEADLKQIDDIMNKQFPELVEFYDNVRKFYQEAGNVLNEAHESIHGYPLFREINEQYYPKKAIKGSATFSESPFDVPPSMEGYGILKERVSNTSGIEGRSFISNLYHHIDMVSNYAGMARPIRDARLILSDRSILHKIGQVIATAETPKGPKQTSYMTEYLQKFLQDVARNLPNTHETIIADTYNQIVRNLQTGALGANLAVMFKQPTSYPIAMSVIKPKHLANPKVLKFVPKSEMELMFKHAPTIWERFTQGHSTIELGDIRAKKDLRGTTGIVRKLQNVNWGWGMSKFDEMSVNRIWNAAKLQVAEHGVKEGTDEFWKQVGALTQEAVYATQPMYDPVFRTGLQRSKNPLLKLGTLFSTQSQQNLNMVVRGIDKIKLGRKKEGLRDISAVLAGTIAVAAAQVGIDEMRGKEGNFADSMAEYTLGTIVFADKAYKAIFHGFNASNLVDDSIANLIKKTDKLLERAYKDPDRKTGYDTLPKLLFDTVGAYANFAGVPVSNVKRTFDELIRSLFPDEVVHKYNGLWRVKGNAELYSEYYDIYSKGDADQKAMVPVLKNLKENGAKSSNLKSSIVSKIQKDMESEKQYKGYTDEQLKKIATQKANNLPYLNMLVK